MASRVKEFYSKPLSEARVKERTEDRQLLQRDQLPLQRAEQTDFSILTLLSPFQSHVRPYSLDEQRRLREYLYRDEPSVISVETTRSLRPTKLSTILDAESLSRTYFEALTRWDVVLQALRSDDPDGIQTSWDVAQRNTYKCLAEWWNNEAYDADSTMDVRRWIEQAARLRLPTCVVPRITRSQYNLVLLSLWVHQFGDERRRDNEDGLRLTATCEAASHRLANRAIRSIYPTKFAKLTRSVSQSRVFDTRNIKLPRTAAAHPCSWINWRQLKEEQLESPFFLWDVVESRTVRRQDLMNPQYTAISHTWGRWQTGTHFRTPAVPWPIPENSLFDVRALPDLLKGAKFPTRYVWMDLLCIPQALAPLELEERGRTEIANQAAIFKLSTLSGAWLNFVSSWTGLESAIIWLSLVYLECGGYSDEETSRHITDAMEGEQFPTGLVTLKDGIYFLEGWFTSLWTLQEICLCPDMILYDKDWRPLALDNFRIPFDHVPALSRILLTASFGDDPHWPNAVRELYYVLIETGIQDLPTMTPTTVLLYGNQRYCQGRRAEAIMSVIGARDWFNDDDPGGGESLMAGRYPFSFVNEVRQKLGAIFFAWADTDYEEVSATGTMLPFSESSFASRRALGTLLNPTDHPSVATWKLQTNGQMLLSQVGIVASTTRRRVEKQMFISAQVPFGSPSAAGGYGEQEIHHYLRTALPTKERHAIALLRIGNHRLFGLLLEFESPGCFRKFGTFVCNIDDSVHEEIRSGEPYEFPASEQVDWVVV
ncbi:hypothetical protein BU26DRAFT_549449 [Trematosphaeria pertusa]|uniref:Heterokaryon incompatibility domain-containing protein n=1 Tax=Trematosphaeria pertusa TaxID=390896 RepID=A0A6A6IKM4_9PLEO|nr:uncharacterized protein BU26DRAFT_549449 [Trematosphaeria pertusa]KAF2250759.1 hypothetical protein BU26DRAFT_549449 [Trematosphaeria pertusa]